MTLSPNLVIVGGGTAGWITANLLARRWQALNPRITLIESPEIGIIGVGEGSTPHLKVFFDEIDVAEKDWMPACNATYKTGIRFRNWSTKPGFSEYFHPFASKIDAFTAPVFMYNSMMRRKGIDIHAHPDRYYLAAELAKQQLAPLNPEHFPFDIGYGYHFDAVLLSQYLRDVAIARDVKHIEGQVVNVSTHTNGDVDALTLDNGQVLHGDYFIDCTGFSALLTGKTLDVPFISYADQLFNDAAVAMPTPSDGKHLPQTDSTALSHGWTWKIPLTNRYGNGYVYSSQYCSADEAETELRTHLGLLDSDVEARHLNIRVGRRERTWQNNVVAVGLAQGFIEPLEATAIHFIIEVVNLLDSALRNSHFDRTNQTSFNHAVNQRFDGIRDYILAHYRLSSRSDTPYWRDNAANNKLPASLVEMINCWTSGGDLNRKVAELNIPGYYPPFSWNCLLAGYGIFPDQTQLSSGNAAAHKYDLDDIDSFICRSALNFPAHQHALDNLRAN